jgi:hypothetical protein
MRASALDELTDKVSVTHLGGATPSELAADFGRTRGNPEVVFVDQYQETWLAVTGRLLMKADFSELIRTVGPGYPPKLADIRQENANPFGQDMLWVTKYAFFTRSILFLRLGGWSNATRREPRPKSFVGARPSDT